MIHRCFKMCVIRISAHSKRISVAKCIENNYNLLFPDYASFLGFHFPHDSYFSLTTTFYLTIIENRSKTSSTLLSYYGFFFYQGFLSRALTTHRAAVEGRRPSFIPLFHFHLLTNIQTFICSFACEWLSYFKSHCLYLPDSYLMRFTTLSNYYLIDWCDVDFCLLVDLILGFVTNIWHEKFVDSNSHRLLSLYYKRTD